MGVDTKKKKVAYVDNPVEQFKEGVKDVAEVPKGIFDEALKQLGLKEQKQPLSGEINLETGVHKTTEKIDAHTANIDSKLRQLHAVQAEGKEIFNSKQKALEQQIGKIMQELAAEVKRLEQQTAELTGEVRAITVDTMPAKPGAYHLNYFEWVISMLRDLRKRINESRMWLSLWSKKKQQKGYWAMFKKHGTSFAMSDERAIASANG